MGNRTRKKRVDVLCDSLCSIGVDAQVIERDEKELYDDTYGISGTAESSLGKIEIKDSPICWVEIRRHTKVHGDASTRTGFGRFTDRRFLYFIRDSSQYNKGHIELRSFRERSLPIFGQVKSIRWKGNFEGDIIASIIRRLRENLVLNQTLIKLNKDIRIHNTGIGGWYISAKAKYPSRELWNCYEIIAHQLSGQGE